MTVCAAADAAAGEHSAGTPDGRGPRDVGVRPRGRLHGTGNVYVADASLLPPTAASTPAYDDGERLAGRRGAHGVRAAPLRRGGARWRSTARGARGRRGGFARAQRCPVGSTRRTGGHRSAAPSRARAGAVDRDGVHDGVQIERNRAQLRATDRFRAPRRTDTPGSLRLGAGRSQVQILSPRSWKSPANGPVLSGRGDIRTGNKRGKSSTGFGVVEALSLALARGPKDPLPGRGAPAVRCARSGTGCSQVEGRRVVCGGHVVTRQTGHRPGTN